MPTYPLRALVLRKTKLGETDIILTLLSEDGRQVRAVAKGMRKPGSRYAGRLEPGSDVDLMVHTGRSLDVVTDARTVEAHAGIREDFDRQAAASVVFDVLDKVSLDGQPDSRLFGLASASLDAMESAPVDALKALVTAFLAKALAMHGLRPELESCATCAADASASSAFSMHAGGALCAACGELDAASVSVAPETRQWVDRLLGARMAEVGSLDMPEQAVADCFTLVRAFASHHLHARLKALDFYATL